MTAKYRERAGCPQRDSVEREGYAGAPSASTREGKERGGAKSTYAVESPCTERYARWCERTAPRGVSYSIFEKGLDRKISEDIGQKIRQPGNALASNTRLPYIPFSRVKIKEEIEK